MPLTEAQVTKRAAKPTFALRIGGIPILPASPNEATGVPGVASWRRKVSFDEPIVTLSVVVNRIMGWMDRGMAVTLDVGYEGVHERRFTGYIKARGQEDPDFARNRVRVLGAEVNGAPITSVATLLGGNNLFKPPGPSGWYSEHEEQHPLVDTQSKADEYAQRTLARLARIPRRPADDINRRTIQCVSQLDKAQRTIEMAARSFDLQTVKQGIENVCNYVGITSRQIDSAFSDFTMGTQSVAALERQPAIQMLLYLSKLIGSSTSPTAEGKFYDSDDGVTMFQVMDELAPAATAFRNVSTETQAQAYIIDNTTHLVIPGDPRIKLGMTIGLVQPRLDLNGRFVVVGVEDIWENGYITDLELRGGDELGGAVGLNPVASFSYSVIFQVIGNALQAIVSGVDQSYDSDGSIVEASSTWADTAATTPEIATFNGRKTFQVRLPANTSGYEVTRTVVDNDGLSRAVTVPIDLNPTTQGYEQPGLFTAQSVGAGASPDGGVTWNDQADATCKSVGALPPDGVHSGEACFGMTNGRIEKTSDWCRSALTQVLAAGALTSGEINDVWPDMNVNGRMWAASSDGKLLKAPDRGVSWSLHKDFGGTYPINRIATPRSTGLPDSVWAYGGRADQPSTFAQFDIGLTGNFQAITIDGELLAACSGASSSITVASASSSQYGDLLLAFKGAAFPSSNPSLYYTADVHKDLGTGATFKKATGLDAGLSEWRWVAPSSRPGIFYGQANNDDIWKIDCTTGTPVCTKLADRLQAGDAPNHGLWEGEFIGGVTDVYLITTPLGIYKWVAEEVTATFLRPATGFPALPASFSGQMSAIGPAARGTTAAGRIAVTTRSASPRTITKMLDSAVWDSLVAMIGVTDNDPSPFWVKPNVCLVRNGNNTPVYSKDGGATFAALPSALNKLVWVARDAGGRIWALCEGTASARTDIYYSDDDGDTWNVSVQEVTRTPGMIVCHPTNQNLICAVGQATFGAPGWVYVSSNRGLSWTEYTGGAYPRVGLGGAPAAPERFGIGWFANGRIIVSGAGIGDGVGVNHQVMTSDDLGASWTIRHSDTGSTKPWFGFGCHPLNGKAVIFRNNASVTPEEGQPLVSLDFGQTWSVLAPTQTYSQFTGTSTDDPSAMVYDYEEDVMYLARDSGSTTKRVAKFAPVTEAGVYTDLQNNIGSTNFGVANITVIPRA